MRKYYHYWLTCPSCHNPHFEQNDNPRAAIKSVSNGLMICKNCNCLFSPVVEFEYNGKQRSLPLPWEIVPNLIEQSYIDWLMSSPIGLFLIIWPWQDVRFSSLLIHESLKVGDASRPIVLFSPNVAPDVDATNEYCVQSPSPNVLWRCLFELDVRDSEILKGPQQKAIYKSIDGLSKAHKTRELKFRTANGSGTIYADANRKDSSEIVPPGSSLISDCMVPRKLNVHYTKRWFVEVADALDGIQSETGAIDQSRKKYQIIYRPQDMEGLPQDAEVLFIKSNSRSLESISPSPDLINNHLINPRIVIVEDVESLLHSFRREEFIAFLSELPPDCLVLMFSVNMRLRYLHDELRQRLPTITTHCWDTPRRIEKLQLMMSHETKFPSPGTSKVSSLAIINTEDRVRLELVNVDQLTDIFTEIDAAISESLEQGTDRWYLREVARYLSHVRRTALPLNTRFHGFTRWSRFRDDTINFYAFVKELRTDDGALTERIKKLGTICEDEHPSLVKLMKILSEQSVGQTIIIAHAEDVSKLRKLLIDKTGREHNVVDWARFSRFTRGLEGKYNLVIIDPPYDGDLLSLEWIDRITVIGDAENNIKTKNIIDIMQASGLSPSFLRAESSAPQLLFNLEEKVRELETEAVSLIPPEADKISTKIDWNDIVRERGAYGPVVASAGEKSAHSQVIVFLNTEGYAVAFPLHSHIAWKGVSGSGINTALELYEKPDKNFTILLSRHEQPLKVRLADWLINEASNNSHRAGKFIWSSYEELILDSIEWVERLKQKASGTDEDILARRIKARGTTAQDEEYIKRWWRVSETPAILTSHGPIMIPYVEHPARLRDLEIIAEVIGDEKLRQQAEKIYCAALEIQRIRNLVINRARESSIADEQNLDIEPELEVLLNEFKKDFVFFEVTDVQLVPYTDNIYLYRIAKFSTSH